MQVCELPPTPSVHYLGYEPAAAGYYSEVDTEPLDAEALADAAGTGSENELGSGPGRCEAADAAAAMDSVVGTGLDLEVSEAGFEACSDISEPFSQPFEVVGPVSMMETAFRRHWVVVEPDSGAPEC